MIETSTSKLSKDVEALSLSDYALSRSTTPQSSNCRPVPLSHRYGALVSQYDTIPASVVTLLEGAILYRTVRAFADCQSTFDLIDRDFRHHPIIAYEEYMAYWAQWRLLDCAKVIENALDRAHATGKDIQRFGLYTLLRIALGKAEVFTKGNFAKARDSMREVRRWLKDATVDQYTDVEIACLSHYYSLVMSANHVTENFDHESFRQLPRVTGDKDKLNLTQLREAVQGQGRLRDAGLILSFEIGFLADENAKEEACRSLLNACKFSGELEPRWLIDSQTRSILAQALRRAGKVSAAERETELAMDLLSAAPVATAKNKAHLIIRLDQMKTTAYSSSQETLDAWTKFSGDDSVAADSMMLSSALGKIADAALEILQADPTVANRALFWKWELQNESVLEQLGDVYFLYISKILTGQTALWLYDEFGAILRRHEDFDTRYPDFQLWTLSVAAKNTLALVYAKFEQQEQVIKTFSEMSYMMRQRDSFWTEGLKADEQYSHQNLGDLDLVDKASDITETRPAFKAENMREEWFSEWAKTGHLGFGRDVRDYNVALGPQLTKGANPYMTTLLRWLKNAMTENEISKSDLALLLAPPESRDQDTPENVDVSSILQRLTPDTLKAHLYGPDSNPTSTVRWGEMFEIFRDWLLYKTRYQETKRQVLLGKLQTEMLETVVGVARHEDILLEAQRMLNLVPTLCEEAQRQFRGTFINWRNLVCGAKKTLYSKQNYETLVNEDTPEFCEILELYKLSLKESRDRGSLHNEATTLLFIAQHYYYAAWNLRPAALTAFFEYLDAADTVYNKIRENWKVLAGWAKVEKLLGAVQEQLRNTIAPLAASVICRFPEGDSRSQYLWTIIQMAKSTGLGWLMRTNHLTTQNHTENTDRLDVGYEDLPMLTVDDLKPITEDASCDVVYVDWYNGSFVGREMPNPIMVSIDPSGSMKASTVTMTWKDINSVVDQFSFDESDLRKDDASKLLQRLNPLVEPLAAITQPGQTLVFSSIGSLHRLPFHALTLDGEILIQRNPIVYCSSLTVLNVVFKARKASEQQETFDSRAFTASLFGDPPSSIGRKALTSLAKKLLTEARIGDESTSSNLTTAITNPGLNLLHYHGHVTFLEGDPKDHGLELDDRRFNLRDVFDLAPLPSSYHATLLGCGSGMSRTTLSNDVLGLVPAFLYSGASSTVSALWPFDDKDAAMYTRHFYEEFDKLLNSGQKGVVDLAKANQRAILAIMDKRPPLYHWAPFVFNGYWMLRLPGK